MNPPNTDEDLLSPWRLQMPELRSPYEPPREAYEQYTLTLAVLINRPFDPSWSETPAEEVEDNEYPNPFPIPELVSASYTRYPFPSHSNAPPGSSYHDWLDQRVQYPTFRPVNDSRLTSDGVNYLTDRTSKMTLAPQPNRIRTAPPKQGVIRTPRKTKQYISYFDEQEQRYVDPSKICIPTTLNLTQALRQTKIGRTPKMSPGYETEKNNKGTSRRKA
jgi:hypothetical protein